MLDSFSTRGVHALSIWPNGRKSLTSNKPLDRSRCVQGTEIPRDGFENPDRPVRRGRRERDRDPFGELYTSLQTGLIDGQENPLDTITTMKFHEVQKNLVVTEHGVMEDIVLFSNAFWNKLNAEQKDIVAKTFEEVRPQVEEMKEAVQNTSLETIKAAKLSVRVADETERKALSDAMAPKARAAYGERAGAEGAEGARGVRRGTQEARLLGRISRKVGTASE